MLSDVQSVRLDTIQDVRLIIGNKKTITMAEDADISWSKKDEIEVNGRSSNSSYKSQIDADVEYSTLLVPYGKRSFLTLRDGTKIWINSGTELRFPANMEKKDAASTSMVKYTLKSQKTKHLLSMYAHPNLT